MSTFWVFHLLNENFSKYSNSSSPSPLVSFCLLFYRHLPQFYNFPLDVLFIFSVFIPLLILILSFLLFFSIVYFKLSSPWFCLHNLTGVLMCEYIFVSYFFLLEEKVFVEVCFLPSGEIKFGSPALALAAMFLCLAINLHDHVQLGIA